MKINIAIVEDNEWYAKLLEHTLRLDDTHEVSVFKTAKEFLDAYTNDTLIVTLDYRLPDMNGKEVMGQLLKRNPQVKVILISEQNEVDIAVDLLKNGATDYLIKHKNLRDELIHSVEKIKKGLQLENRVVELEKIISADEILHSEIIGEDATLRAQLKLVNKAANSDITAMVTGETGTGKEVIAKAIHNASDRRDKPFVGVNIAAIPRELIESELFGHVKGAFTGASIDRAGLFEQAGSGTLFLDEIGELDMALQVKLLRVLQEEEYVRVGDTKMRKVKCRIISATNLPLEQRVQSGDFREDLFYRLYGIRIHLPPLRERGQDKILLAEHFVTSFCKRKKMDRKLLSKEAKSKLSSYDFPGNIRELKSVVELAITLTDDNVIEADSIQFPRISLEKKLFAENRTMNEYEHLILKHFLDRYDDISKIASILDISRSKIYRMMKESGVSK